MRDGGGRHRALSGQRGELEPARTGASRTTEPDDPYLQYRAWVRDGRPVIELESEGEADG